MLDRAGTLIGSVAEEVSKTARDTVNSSKKLSFHVKHLSRRNAMRMPPVDNKFTQTAARNYLLRKQLAQAWFQQAESTTTVTVGFFLLKRHFRERFLCAFNFKNRVVTEALITPR